MALAHFQGPLSSMADGLCSLSVEAYSRVLLVFRWSSQFKPCLVVTCYPVLKLLPRSVWSLATHPYASHVIYAFCGWSDLGSGRLKTGLEPAMNISSCLLLFVKRSSALLHSSNSFRSAMVFPSTCQTWLIIRTQTSCPYVGLFLVVAWKLSRFACLYVSETITRKPNCTHPFAIVHFEGFSTSRCLPYAW